MNIKFSRILALTAMLIAGCAAYYSVFGLSQLFAGASIAVIIMASVLEVSKIVAVSFLQRYWSKVGKGLTSYLSVGVIILMIITSAGIYGFLSNAYQKTAIKSEIYEGQMGVVGGKKGTFQKALSDNDKIIENKNKRITQLTDLRTTQEGRMDLATNPSDKRRVRGDIESATQEIQKLSNDVDLLTAKNNVINDSISHYSSKEFDIKSGSAVAGELGPLKYLAELTGKPMGTVVNWFILLLIFVFDPLAIALVVATNKVLELEKKKDEEVKLTEEDREFLNFDIGDIVQPPFQNVHIPTPVDDVPESDDNIPENDEELIVEEHKPEVIVEEPKSEAIAEEPKVDVNTEEPKRGIRYEDIKEIKEKYEGRGYSVPVPHPKKSNNEIGRIN